MSNNICLHTACVLVCGSLAALSASPRFIGVARSNGAFLINNATVPGTATILDGTSIQTLSASSDVTLKAGGRLTLASNSAARIYEDHLVLERGVTELALDSYRVDAHGLMIAAASGGSLFRVAVDGEGKVRVASLRGTGEVHNSQGVLVARILPGTTFQLWPNVGNEVIVTGTVETHGAKFFLTDETTKVRVELLGPSLKSLVGKRLQVRGSALPSEPAGAEVVAVDQATPVDGSDGATGTNGTLGAPHHGVVAGAAAVVGGVAVAATVGGLVVSGTLGGGSNPVSR